MKIFVSLFAVIIAMVVYWARDESCSSDPDVSFQIHNRNTVVDTCHVFSDDFATAQHRFIEIASRASSPCELFHLPVIPDSSYTMDICLIRGKLPGLVVHISGTHGVEGYSGSAIQLAYLNSITKPDSDHLPTIVIVHAFNPFGMASYRRFNERNVDLNRNAVTQDQRDRHIQKHAATYDKFRSLFQSEEGVQTSSFSVYVLSWFRTIVAVVKHGAPALKAALVQGQYHVPTGLFYGGDGSLEKSVIVLEEFLEKHVFDDIRANDVVTWIDVHTGLGASGEDTILPTEPSRTSEALSSIEKRFPGAKMVGSNDVSQGYEEAQGKLIGYFDAKFTSNENSDSLFFTQEFGTVPTMLAGNALMCENSAFHDASLTADEKILWSKRTTKRAFYPARSAWRVSVLQRGIDVLQRAIQRSVDLSITN